MDFQERLLVFVALLGGFHECFIAAGEVSSSVKIVKTASDGKDLDGAETSVPVFYNKYPYVSYGLQTAGLYPAYTGYQGLSAYENDNRGYLGGSLNNAYQYGGYGNQNMYDDGRYSDANSLYGNGMRYDLGSHNAGGLQNQYASAGFKNSYRKDESGGKSHFYNNLNNDAMHRDALMQNNYYANGGIDGYQGRNNYNLYDQRYAVQEGRGGDARYQDVNRGRFNQYGRAYEGYPSRY